MVPKIASQPLPQLPPGSNVFIDANIFVYGLNGVSAQCKLFLERCSREEVTGITLFEIVNEATHQFMLAEAKQKGLISSPSPRELRTKFRAIAALTKYWTQTERILALNLLFLASEESLLRSAQAERTKYCLLTNDSMIVACMRSYGVSCVATSDKDFRRVQGIAVYSPNDLP
jgi:predicted nucleic acid-binding protein